MKVLFATDGSPQDRHAREFVASAAWAPGTEIELFGVIRPVTLAVTGELVDRNVHDFERQLDHLATTLPQRDCLVTWRTGFGEPATEIVARAGAIGADLIIVGSRGRGPLATSILGSVSAGVIDHSPCPVLVARRDEIKRIVLADDGSAGAALAAALLDEWPVFADASLRIISVADVTRAAAVWDLGPVPYPAEERTAGPSLAQAREHARETVAARAFAAKPRPRATRTIIREGDAAEQILAAAQECAADLVAVGTRGQTGLSRLVVGSVARKVLLGAKCSVLVARGQADVARDRPRADGRVLAITAALTGVTG